MTTPLVSTYVRSRRIGDAVVTVISEGTFRWAPHLQAPDAEWRAEMPDADTAGRIPLGLNVVHIRTSGASILVDPGWEPPSSPWSAEALKHWDSLQRTPGLEAGLAAIGITPDEITHVVITHAHDDHFCGVTRQRDGQPWPSFPSARCLIGRADWEDNPVAANPETELARRLGCLEAQGLLHLVDGDRELTPGVTMIQAPGESPGHSIVHLESAGESFYAVGDLFHHPCEVRHLDWVSPFRNRDQMRSSRERLLAEATRSRALVLFTHAAFPGWGRIELNSAGHRWVPDEL